MATRISWFAMGILLFVLAGMVQAGKVVVIKETDLDEGKVSQVTIYLDRDKLRADTEDPDGKLSMIYVKGLDQYLLAHHGKKKYAVITRAEMEKMGQQVAAQMSEVMKQMQEQLKNVPPEQRQMIEEMMKGKMSQQMASGEASSTQEPREVYKKVGSGIQVGEWTCDHYQVFADGEKVKEVWTVKPEKIGFTEADFAVFEELDKLFSAMVPENMQDPSRDKAFFGDETLKKYGLPIKEVNFMGGRPTSQSVVQRIENRSLSADLFQAPSGYQKASNIMELMMGG